MSLLKFDNSTIIFGQEFSFTNPATLNAAVELASDCETVEEFKSYLNAEEVFYKATPCKLIQP